MKPNLIFLFLVFCTFAYADSNLKYTLSHFEDTSKQLNEKEIVHQEFTPVDKGVQNLGITNTPSWFKLEFYPSAEQIKQEWWLKIDYPPLDYIDYFLYEEDRLIHALYTGELRTFKDREIEDPSFINQIPFRSDKKHTLYLRVQTEGALQVPISLYTTKELIRAQYLPLIIAGIYYGLFIIIVLYNSVIYLYTKDLNYLYYLTFVNGFVFWQLSLDGIGIAYIWGEYPWIIEHASVFGTSFVAFSAILFSRKFLHTSEFLPKFDPYLKYLMYFCFVLTLAAFVAPYHFVVKIDGLLSIFVPIMLFTTGILVLRDGYKAAKFYTIGWFVFLVGCILFALNKFNLIGGFYLMNHAQQIGSAVEMLMLSWALGDRIKSIQDEYLQKTKELNTTLQTRLEKALFKERHKDKIMMQQSRFAALGEMIEQIAHQWRQPLNNLALIHQDLYFKFQLQKFSPEAYNSAHEKINDNLQYMSKTIDDFRSFYKDKTDAETYNVKDLIDSAISLSESMLKYAKIEIIIKSEELCYVHNIKNELLQVCMNIIKNAHDALVLEKEEDRKIIIDIYHREDYICIDIEDNAGGIEEDIIHMIFNPYFTTKADSHGTGIGLYMSKSIMQEHLNGSISVKNAAEGACFTLCIPQAEATEKSPVSV